MIHLPRISSYGNYSSSNYGANCMYVSVGPIEIWYSYQTPVAFRVEGHSKVVHSNDWGPTTGKHLNWIDDGDKSSRVSSEEFQRLWGEQVEPLLGEDEPKQESAYKLGLAESVA